MVGKVLIVCPVTLVNVCTLPRSVIVFSPDFLIELESRISQMVSMVDLIDRRLLI